MIVSLETKNETLIGPNGVHVRFCYGKQFIGEQGNFPDKTMEELTKWIMDACETKLELGLEDKRVFTFFTDNIEEYNNWLEKFAGINYMYMPS